MADPLWYVFIESLAAFETERTKNRKKKAMQINSLQESWSRQWAFLPPQRRSCSAPAAAVLDFESFYFQNFKMPARCNFLCIEFPPVFCTSKKMETREICVIAILAIFNVCWGMMASLPVCLLFLISNISISIGVLAILAVSSILWGMILSLIVFLIQIIQPGFKGVTYYLENQTIYPDSRS